MEILDKINKTLNIIEKILNKKAKNIRKKQPGDMVDTYSDIRKLKTRFKFYPKVKLKMEFLILSNGIKNYNNFK